jgi:hypothetical protein
MKIGLKMNFSKIYLYLFRIEFGVFLPTFF